MKPTIPSLIKPWLYDPDSFMQRARKHCLQPQVVVLKQGWFFPEEDEGYQLQVKPRRYVFVREVLIHHQKTPLMLARTAIPKETLTGRERRLMYLGNKPIGSFLFSHPEAQRMPFEVEACQLPQYSATWVWRRRSLFYMQKKPLLLTETFLPELFALLPLC